MIETLLRWKNWIRIKFLEIFTSRIKRVSITDERGKQHDVVIEKNLEKVCEHKTITEIAPTMWKCSGCDDIYFQISYKVMLTQQDLVQFLGTIADHFKLKVEDHA